MKFFRLDLLTLLISLFILNSCKNEDTIGLGIDSSTQLNGSLIDTSTIIVNTQPDAGNPLSKDSISTSGILQNTVGYFNDPVFGTTESNISPGCQFAQSNKLIPFLQGVYQLIQQYW